MATVLASKIKPKSSNAIPTTEKVIVEVSTEADMINVRRPLYRAGG